MRRQADAGKTCFCGPRTVRFRRVLASHLRYGYMTSTIYAMAMSTRPTAAVAAGERAGSNGDKMVQVRSSCVDTGTLRFGFLAYCTSVRRRFCCCCCAVPLLYTAALRPRRGGAIKAMVYISGVACIFVFMFSTWQHLLRWVLLLATSGTVAAATTYGAEVKSIHVTCWHGCMTAWRMGLAWPMVCRLKEGVRSCRHTAVVHIVQHFLQRTRLFDFYFFDVE